MWQTSEQRPYGRALCSRFGSRISMIEIFDIINRTSANEAALQQKLTKLDPVRKVSRCSCDMPLTQTAPFAVKDLTVLINVLGNRKQLASILRTHIRPTADEYLPKSSQHSITLKSSERPAVPRTLIGSGISEAGLGKHRCPQRSA